MTSNTLQIATENDSSEILSIYSQYIDTPITFETSLPDIRAFRERITEINSFFPYIVCIQEEKIVGYAYAHKFRERPAYRWDVELSIYVDKEFQNYGIGKSLYNSMIEILKLQNIINAYACVTTPNEKSEMMHKSLGFKQIAKFEKSGYKCSSWHDIVWFEKNINSFDDYPKEIISINEIDSSKIDNILKKYSK